MKTFFRRIALCRGYRLWRSLEKEVTLRPGIQAIELPPKQRRRLLMAMRDWYGADMPNPPRILGVEIP